MFELGFMQRALAAGVLIALAAGYFGAHIVQRRQAFLGHGLAHAAFGGVALGLLLGVPPLWVALPFTVLLALAMAALSQRAQLSQDTAIGIMFSLALALGIVFLALKPGYSADAMTYLFGSLLAIDALDVWLAGALAVLPLLTLPLWGRLAYATFDRDSALADRVPAARDDYWLAALIAMTVVVAVKIVGALLVSAFLVIPAASARVVSRRFATMTWLSVVLAAASVLVGIPASYALDLPTGACIVFAQGAIFGLALLMGRR